MQSKFIFIQRLTCNSASTPLTFHAFVGHSHRLVLTSFITNSTTGNISTARRMATSTRRSSRLVALAREKDNNVTISKSKDTGSKQVLGNRKQTSQKRKASSTNLEDDDGHDNDSIPQPTTPPRKRSPSTKNHVGFPPPKTPTPAGAALLGKPVKNLTPKPKARAIARLANPQGTNAALISPSSSRVVASKSLADISPSKLTLTTPTTTDTIITTDNILEEACQHLISIDPRFKTLIAKHPCRIFSPEGLAEKIDPFESLCSGVISQQVSGAAAKSIKARFIALFSSDSSGGSEKDATEVKDDKARFPTPAQVESHSIEALRTAGLSQRKAEYILGIAQHFTSGTLSTTHLHSAPYAEVLSRLIAVRGLGQWSVEMFACFALKRMDVFSVGDLGVQRGMAAWAERDVAKLKKAGGGKWKYMSEKDMLRMAEAYAPYRSLFMWYMWRVEETDVSSMG